MRSFPLERAHYLADLLTLLRFIIAFVLVYFTFHNFNLRVVSLFVISGWGTDLFDGRIARISGGTFLGWFDLPADLCFSASIFLYEIHRGFIPLKTSLMLTTAFLMMAITFKSEAPFMFWMGMIYGIFIILVFLKDLISFIALILWIIFTVFLDFSRTSGQIKKFFSESRKIIGS